MGCRSLLLVFIVGLAGACSSSSTPDQPPTSSGTNATCTTDNRIVPYAAGLKATSPSGKLVAEILNADPSPPQRGAGDAGLNVWTMRFTLDGSPLQQAVSVTAAMPDHGHASPKTPKVAVNPDGTQVVEDVYLFMGGVWEITFTTGNENAMFSLCVE